MTERALDSLIAVGQDMVNAGDYDMRLWALQAIDALTAERDRADQAEAVIARALYICHNYGTRDPLPANLYKTLKPYERTTAWREATA